MRTLKPKKCRICKRAFNPISSLSKVCSVPCSLEMVRQDNARKEERAKRADRAETRAALERMKTRGDHLKELQQAFNAWIRERDAGHPCISCGRLHKGKWNAGHYRSVGSCPELRFEPDNVHLQCEPCNTYLSGNLIPYRVNLIKKIGLARVEWIEGPHEPKKYSVEQIQEMKAFYRAEVRRMKKATQQPDFSTERREDAFA